LILFIEKDIANIYFSFVDAKKTQNDIVMYSALFCVDLLINITADAIQEKNKKY